MTQYIAGHRDAGTAFAVFVCAISALAAGVDGYSMPLASDPTNVRNGASTQWDLPGLFGRVTIPGASVTDSNSMRYVCYDVDGQDIPPVFYSPLQPVDAYSRDSTDEHGDSGYESFWNSGSRSGSSLSLASSPPSPLSTGRVWRSNNNNKMGKNIDSFRMTYNRRSGSRSVTRPWVTPALSMANYMQNGGPGNGNDSNRNTYNNNNNNNNRDYNINNRENHDYDDRNGNNRGNRGPYDNDNDRLGPPRGGQPRGTNRFNTVGGVGSVNGANVSREGRSMQFQNRRDSNTAGRSGRMMDDESFTSFAPDSNSRFESRRPNDNYSRGGYRQDARTGHWTDPNSNNNNNPRPTLAAENRYASPPSTPSSFPPIPQGDYVSAPQVREPVGYERGRVGAGGNVPYDNANYRNSNNNPENRDYYDYNQDPNNSDNDYYSRNGNIMDNRRGSRGDQISSGGPGMDQNYYNVDDRNQNSNQRLDRGGGLMKYRPNNQRADGGYYGNGNEYEVGGFDDRYDSSGSLYNSEGKRVRRFDPYSDRSEGYYNPEHLSNDSTDPGRTIQNKRRRDGRDVQNGAHLRRYDPEWDGRQGLYDEASLYGSDVKGTRQYASGYGDNMDNRVVARGRRRGSAEYPSVSGGGRGEVGGRDRYPMSSTRDYREGDHIEDGYDRGQDRFNRQGGDRYRRSDSGREQHEYDDYDVDDRERRGGMRRGLGRRDVESEREYYRSGDHRGPDLRGDDSMERFRQGKDVKKTDLYGVETDNTSSSKKRIQRSKRGRVGGNKQSRNGDDMRGGRSVNGNYNNAPPSSSRNRRRNDGGRTNGSVGGDRGLSLDDLNEML